MNTEELRDYCLQKPHTEEGFPFDQDTLVFKVGGKMYLLISLEQGNSFNAKCDPEKAIELREQHTEVQPGYHMSKKHWNTVYMDGSLTRKQLCEMIDHSYDLVVDSLPKKVKAELLDRYTEAFYLTIRVLLLTTTATLTTIKIMIRDIIMALYVTICTRLYKLHSNVLTWPLS